MVYRWLSTDRILMYFIRFVVKDVCWPFRDLSLRVFCFCFFFVCFRSANYQDVTLSTVVLYLNHFISPLESLLGVILSELILLDLLYSMKL